VRCHARADRRRVMHLGPGVVEEGVIGLGVDMEFHVETKVLQLRFERGGGVGAEEVVALGNVGEHMGPHLRIVGLRLGPGITP